MDYIPVGVATAVRIRPYGSDDLPSLLALLNRALLPGDRALHGEPTKQPLFPPRSAVHVAVDLDGTVQGGVCLSVRPSDDVGLIHWLCAGENPAVIRALLAHAQDILRRRRVYAFSYPGLTAPVGVPGVAVQHRAVVVDALIAAYFAPYASQSYLLVDDLDDLRDELEAAPRPSGESPAEATPLIDASGWRVRIKRDGRALADAVLLAAVEGTALLWHLHVCPDQRRKGLGGRLLHQCLALANDAGARRVAAYIDPSNTALFRVLTAYQFRLVDTLTVFRRDPG